MIIKRAADIKPSEITPQCEYENRRKFMQNTGALLLGGLVSPMAAALSLDNVKTGSYSVSDSATSLKDITRYNNFYEFGTEKDQPARSAKAFKTSPWKIKVEGEVKSPGEYHLEDFIKPHTLEERVYRFRCVEAWSMVIPWVGIPLQQVIKKLEPGPSAKFVEFTTLFDPEQMPGQRRPILPWPYIEGLRMDEAMHPLALLAVGLYGKVLPNQNGAPIRLVVPWKYGFKSIKSIVKIRFSKTLPKTTWALAGPNEYGFYANVNPTVDHPRWSQARERRIGEFLKRKTLMFNGYGEQVAGLYQGMDLKQYF